MKEFKILEFRKKNTSNEAIEQALAEKSAEGWEVVSMTSDISSDLRGVMTVLLQREQKEN